MRGIRPGICWHGYPRYEGLMYRCITLDRIQSMCHGYIHTDRKEKKNGQSFMEGDCND